MDAMKRLALMVGLCVGFPACAGNPTPSVRPAIVSEQLALAVQRAQTLEIELHQQGQVSDTQHKTWQRRFLLLGQGIQALNASLRASSNPTIRYAAIQHLLDILQEMSEVLIPDLDFDGAKLWLQTAIDVIRGLLVTTSTQPGVPVSWTLQPSPLSCA